MHAFLEPWRQDTLQGSDGTNTLSYLSTSARIAHEAPELLHVRQRDLLPANHDKL